MNRILVETHKKQNINYLRVRDYFFNKARKLNTLKIFLLVLPTIMLVLSYMPFLTCFAWVNDNRDYYMGFFSFFCFAGTYFIGGKIDEKLKISNAFREEYDVHVFGIRKNDYYYDEEYIKKYIEVANNTIKDSKKYEYWYEEIFSSNHINNVICCQMDNVIYTYYVYKKTNQVYKIGFGFLGVFMIGLWIVVKDVQFMVLSLIAIFSLLQMFIDYISVSNSLIKSNKFLHEKIRMHEGDFTDEDVRSIQDCIIFNREKSLFIPKYIRDMYLEDENPYYLALDNIKEKLMGLNTASMPSSTADIEILSSNGNEVTNLSVIHARLRDMLSDIRDVFEKYEIQYTLDGGTLLGAIREGGKFIFWDDDVDLAIRYDNFKYAKEVLKKELADKYELQDYDEAYYSPRLSCLRIREKNEFSIVEERDSALFELYEKRGLFIDIYVYAPILCNRFVDRIFRKLCIHSINKSIKKTEEKWKSDRQKYSTIFVKKKEKYMKRVNWYLEHAKCTKYYAYAPNYIENLKHPGPYIKESDLYGERVYSLFEDLTCRVPNNSEAVLEAFYGEKWNESPFVPLKQLTAYSKKKFSATKLKHILYVDLLKNE